MSQLKDNVTTIMEYRKKVGEEKFYDQLENDTLPYEVAGARILYESFVKSHSFEEASRLLCEALGIPYDEDSASSGEKILHPEAVTTPA